MIRFQQRQRARVRGFTLVEAVMSMLVVSILLVSAMRVTASSSLMQYKVAERAKARFLAEGLLNEIMLLSYEDPVVTPLFGRESGELSTAKANYDDVDDFDGWKETPPQNPDGTTMPNLTGWQRAVSVLRVSPTNLTQVSSSETGAKQITVTVTHNSVVLATRIAYRTRN